MIFKSGLNKARKGREVRGRATVAKHSGQTPSTGFWRGDKYERGERGGIDGQESFAYGINYHSEGVGLLLFETADFYLPRSLAHPLPFVR